VGNVGWENILLRYFKKLFGELSKMIINSIFDGIVL
jgi:hypothetical protein